MSSSFFPPLAGEHLRPVFFNLNKNIQKYPKNKFTILRIFSAFVYKGFRYVFFEENLTSVKRYDIVFL